jgi:hypothetical protein
MAENAHKGILNREEAERVALEALSSQIALLEQMANYGTNLLVRVLRTNSSNHIGDVVVCSVFLRQIVAMLDLLAVSFRAGSTHMALLAARPGFEASFYLEWMLISDTQKKGEHYYVSNLRRVRKWALRAIGGTKQNLALSENPRLKDLIDSVSGQVEGDAQAQVDQFNQICSKDPYKTINDDFERLGKGKRDVDWHVPLGAGTIRDIAKTLDRLVEYDLFYSTASQHMHSSEIGMHINSNSKDKFTIKPLRGLDRSKLIIQFCVTAAYQSFKLVLQKYRPGELKELGRIYVEEWRGPFLATPKITMNYTGQAT